MPVYQSKSATADGKSYFFKTKFITADSDQPKIRVSKKYMTREEAMRAEQEFIVNIVRYKNVPVYMTFQELYDKFLEDRKTWCKFTTLQTYPNMYKYIKQFMKIRCVDYSTEHFLQWKKNMYSRKKISLRYKNDILKHWKSILNFGTKMYNFDFSFVYRKMDKFKDPNARKKEMKFYTLDEFNKFISAEDELMWQCYFKTLYYCGLRCGESRGLKWKDVNLTKNILSVKRQVIQHPNEDGTNYVLSDPKTPKSIRTIPICATLSISLKKYQQSLIDNNIYDNENFVFGDGNLPLSEHYILKRKKRNTELSGVKYIRTHDFRHSCASLLINNGANVTMVARYLGHSQIDETLNTYSHMFPSALNDVLNIINDLNSEKSTKL